MNPIRTNKPVFFGDDGEVLKSGQIYIGQPNQWPLSFPKTVTLQDSAGSQFTAAQPLTTNNQGRIEYNGKSVIALVDGDYSILVRDRNGVTVGEGYTPLVDNATAEEAPSEVVQVGLLLSDIKLFDVTPGETVRNVGKSTTLDGLGADWLVVSATGSPADDVELIDFSNGTQGKRIENVVYRNDSDILNKKVDLAGLEPERVSSTILRIFPGFCSDGAVNPTDTIELDTSYDIDRTASGLGGVDNGVYEANVNYFVYMLKNPTTGDVGAVLSKEISTSLVTKPSGYTLIRKLPWGFISVAGGIPSFHISYWPLPFTRYTDSEEAEPWRVLALGTDVTFTEVTMDSLIPDNARLAYIMVRVERVSSAGKCYLRTGGAQSVGVPCGYVPDIIGSQAYNFLHIRTTSTRSISYRVDSGVRASIYVLGYSQTERS